MVRRKGDQARALDELIIQRFPNRCPYCNEPISYESINLKIGENEVNCPSCKKKFIKVVFNSEKL